MARGPPYTNPLPTFIFLLMESAALVRRRLSFHLCIEILSHIRLGLKTSKLTTQPDTKSLGPINVGPEHGH